MYRYYTLILGGVNRYHTMILGEVHRYYALILGRVHIYYAMIVGKVNRYYTDHRWSAHIVYSDISVQLVHSDPKQILHWSKAVCTDTTH